ncbi:ornithine--oxo-acid transaminase [Streptomyces badius]
MKTARKWGYRVKGVPDGMAKIIVASGNFHGRYHDDRQLLHRPGGAGRLRPVHPGLRDRAVRDLTAMREAMTENTVAGADRADPGRGGGAGVPPPVTSPAYGS